MCRDGVYSPLRDGGCMLFNIMLTKPHNTTQCLKTEPATAQHQLNRGSHVVYAVRK